MENLFDNNEVGEFDFNAAVRARNYRTDLEAVHQAFEVTWETFCEYGPAAAAWKGIWCVEYSADRVAYGLATALWLLEPGRAGQPVEQAWIRASGLYQQLFQAKFQKPATIVALATDRNPIEGISAPAAGESLGSLNDWRGRYGLSPVTE